MGSSHAGPSVEQFEGGHHPTVFERVRRLALAVALLAGCRGGASLPGSTPAPPTASAAAQPLPPVWEGAARGDPASLDALARGPLDDLVAGLAAGWAAPACRAAALHPRGEGALRHVAAALPSLSGAARAACVEAIAELAARAPVSGEPEDPDGLAAALAATTALARDAGAAREERAAAATAAWLLAERRGAEPPELPAELY